MEATGDSSLPDRTGSVAVRHRIARWASVFWSFVLALMIAQHFYGIGLNETIPIGPKAQIRPDGKGWQWRLPARYQKPLMDSASMLFENGEPFVNHAKSNETVREKGAGWHRFSHGKVRFAPLDGSNPTKNGRIYEIRTPKQFRQWQFALVGTLSCLSLLAFCLTRPTSILATQSPPRKWIWQAVLLWTGAISFFLIRDALAPPFSDGALCLKNVPLSDGSGWHQMARGFAEGHGLDADFQESRPLHPVCMTPVYWLTGGNLKSVRVVNCLLLSFSVLGVWLLGMCLRSPWVAWGAAFGAGLLPDHTALTHMVMTENSGMPLAILAALGVLLCTWHLSPRWSYVAGLVSGIGNLACGFTLFTLPFYAFVVLINPLIRRAPWQRSILMAVLFTAGVSTVLLPWLIRQKVVNDRFTLTFSTSDLLYGGANADAGGFHSEAFREAEKKGHFLDTPLKRYDYFSSEFRRIVAADPAAYFKRVGRCMIRSFGLVRLLEPATVTLGLILLLGWAVSGVLGGAGGVRLLSAGILMRVWLEIEPDTLLPAFLASWVITLRRARWPEERLALLILGLTILSVAILDGLGGNTAPRRFWLTADWALILILFLGLVRSAEATESILRSVSLRLPRLPNWIAGEPKDKTERQLENVAPWVRAASLTTVAYTLMATVLTLTLTALGTQRTWPGLGSIEPFALLQQSMSQHPQIELRSGSSKLRGFIARLDDLIIPIQAGEDLGHWLPGFGAREADRNVVTVSTLGPDGDRIIDVEVTIFDKVDLIPRGQPLFWIVVDSAAKNGISGEAQSVSEALGVVPLQRNESGKWHSAPQGQIWFRLSEVALSKLKP